MPEFMEIEIVGADILAEKLAVVSERILDLQPAFELILPDILEITNRQIHSQGRRGGGSWAQLKSDTVRKKGTAEILYTAGANEGYSKFGDDTLVRSVTEAEAPYQTWLTDPNSFIFGTTVPHARIQQEGAPSRNIPARPFLRVLDGDVARWNAIIARYFMEPMLAKE